MKRGIIIWIIIVALLVIVGVVGYNFYKVSKISNFEECISAGFPAMESHPRKCMTSDGRLFVEEITWRNDGINIGYIPESDFYGCYGCGRVLCIDPVPTVQFVDETENFRCDEDFNLIRG